jgi:TDG/mug DNA glycosylase family protein
MEYTHVTHEFPPLYDRDSEILILGSVPSPKSREQGFYYGHPRNRFWQVMAAVLGEPVPGSIPEKKALMLRHHVALYDSIEECDIRGASDTSIRNVIPADIPAILQKTRIREIFCTGTVSFQYYEKYCYPQVGIHARRLPSTSPANCAVSLEQLTEAYRIIAVSSDRRRESIHIASGSSE